MNNVDRDIQNLHDACNDIHRISIHLDGLASALSRIGLDQPANELSCQADRLRRNVDVIEQVQGREFWHHLGQLEESSHNMFRAAVAGVALATGHSVDEALSMLTKHPGAPVPADQP